MSLPSGASPWNGILGRVKGQNTTQPPDTIHATQASKEKKENCEEKQQYWHFKRQASKISHEKTWTYLRKESLKKGTKSIPRAAQNNSIRTKYVKANIDKTEQNSRCRLYDNRHETIDHIISVCSKISTKRVQDYTRLGGVSVPLITVQEV